jgi:polysaccharide biosynthesis transport protein
MNISEYIAPVLRWWWLLILATIAAGASSFYATSQQPPLYQSRTTLLIGQSISNPNPSSNQFYLEEQLASIYADMGTREPVRKATMDALGLTWLPDYLVRVIPDSQMVEISVTDTNPVRAQAVAAELARQLIRRTPTNSNPQDQDRREFVNQQLDQIQLDIRATQKEIENLKLQLGSMTSARQIGDTERQITTLQTKLTSLNSNYAGLLANSDKGALNTLNIIEDAEVPTRPISGNKMMTVLLSAMVGLALATGSAYTIEFFDQTIKSSNEAEKIMNSLALAEIPKVKESGDHLAHILTEPYTPFSDAFRSLRINLEMAGLGSSIRSLLITSTGVSDGKTTVSSNLLFALAEGKKSVVLVDADLYRSPLEEKIDKEGSADPYETGKYYFEELNIRVPVISLKRMLSATYEGQTFPSNPTEILGSPQAQQLFSDLRKNCDIIIIDCPPFFLSDTMILSMNADAVLVVVKQNQTRKDGLERMMEQIRRANMRLVGFVLNNASQTNTSHYQYYYRGLHGTPKAKKKFLAGTSERSKDHPSAPPPGTGS